MANTSKATVTGANEHAVTVLVLSGDYKDNIYRMPPRENVRIDQFVDILVHGEGTRAEWPETA